MLWDETILGAKKEGEKKEESSCCLRRIECKQNSKLGYKFKKKKTKGCKELPLFFRNVVKNV